MRFLCMVRMDEAQAAEAPPAIYQAMGAYEQEGRANGTLVESQGLLPSAAGAIVTIADGRAKAIDGPFAEAKELIAGFWIFNVQSKQEAIDWVRRCPDRKSVV